MTLQEQAEVRRPSVGTKVLMVGLAVFAVLGSFWTIVWFIRAYVEAPRVGIPATMALAARESTPVVPPAPIGEAQKPAVSPAPSAADSASAQAQADAPGASSAITDRWLPMTPAAAPPAPPEPVAETTGATPGALATT